MGAGGLDAKGQPAASAGFRRRREKEFGPQADAKNRVFRVRDSEDGIYTDQSLLFTYAALRRSPSTARLSTTSCGWDAKA